MSGLVKKPKDLSAGLFFLLVSLVVLFVSSGYEFGTARRMGPGYFPICLAGLLLAFASILIARSFRGDQEDTTPISWRQPALILGGALLFGLLIRPAGLVLAIVPMVLIGSLASSEIKPHIALLLSLALAAGSTLVFVYGLGQPIPVLGYWIPH